MWFALWLMAFSNSVEMYIAFKDGTDLTLEVERQACEKLNDRMSNQPVFIVIQDTGQTREAALIICRGPNDME